MVVVVVVAMTVILLLSMLLLVEGLQILVRVVVVLVVELDVQLCHANRTKDHLRMANHEFWITGLQDLEFESAHIIVAAQSPKSSLLYPLHPIQLQDLKTAGFIDEFRRISS